MRPTCSWCCATSASSRSRTSCPWSQKRNYIVGTHHPEGVFLAYGPGIEAGKLLGRRNITDVASTLLYSLGLDVPADFEGVVPPAPCSRPQHKAARPITIGAATAGGAEGELAETMDEEEKQQILDQLQMLGYME
jgi:hypothetical protein